MNEPRHSPKQFDRLVEAIRRGHVCDGEPCSLCEEREEAVRMIADGEWPAGLAPKGDDPLSEQIGGDHYLGYKIQPFVFVRENNIPHAEGEVLYKVLRHRDKGGLQDILKAIHELEIIARQDYGWNRPNQETILSSTYGVQDNDRPWVYIAAPYTSDPKNNTRRALKLADEVWRLGYWPIVPHLTHWWNEQTPRSYARWMEYVKALARRCDVVLRDSKRCPGSSPGADQEERLGVPVVYSLEELRQRFPPDGGGQNPLDNDQPSA